MRRSFLALLLILSLVCGGCHTTEAGGETEENQDAVGLPQQQPEEETETTVPGQKTAIALAYNPSDSLNPFQVTTEYNYYLLPLIYEGLFAIGPDFQLENVLCESYEVDGDQWTFYIKQGVLFHDGTEMQARDVVYSINQARKSTLFASRCANITSCTYSGRYTVRIRLGTPDSQRPGRYASVNGAAPRRAAGLAGSFPAVVFDPGHLSLVKGAPEGRRKFLDAALCQLYPGYLTVYRRYLRALQQKNALLRRSPAGQERPYAEKMALLEVLNTELAAQGEAIQQRRRAYLERLAPLACANYEELSHGAERMELRYAAQFEPGGLAALLKARQNEEVRAGQSLCGPHREDLELLLDGQPARVFASQGQQRSVVLSLKMAEAAAAAAITGEHPVLLLDDVLSELDDGRKQYLLTRMREKQTFVTSCDDTAFLKTDGEVYRMNGGVLSKI